MSLAASSWREILTYLGRVDHGHSLQRFPVELFE